MVFVINHQPSYRTEEYQVELVQTLRSWTVVARSSGQSTAMHSGALASQNSFATLISADENTEFLVSKNQLGLFDTLCKRLEGKAFTQTNVAEEFKLIERSQTFEAIHAGFELVRAERCTLAFKSSFRQWIYCVTACRIRPGVLIVISL